MNESVCYINKCKLILLTLLFIIITILIIVKMEEEKPYNINNQINQEKNKASRKVFYKWNG